MASINTLAPRALPHSRGFIPRPHSLPPHHATSFSPVAAVSVGATVMTNMRLSRKRKMMQVNEELAVEELNILKHIIDVVVMFFIFAFIMMKEHYDKYILKDNVQPDERKMIHRMNTMDRLFNKSDVTCIEQLRMNRHTFHVLCTMLRLHSGLKDTKYTTLEEHVATFLNIMGHHHKQRIVKFKFARSQETISRNFRRVLGGVIRLHTHLIKAPQAVSENCTDERWKWFKNCIGALDGTYIKVCVAEEDKPRYRSRKGEIATNVLGACSQDMQFTFILPGWEGSAADSRILRDAVSRTHGLKVPRGYFYLVDAGYPNSEGFLAPYRGQRYHLASWRDGTEPSSPEELFNKKHAAARNVIERAFGLLKLRWGILREFTWYPVDVHVQIIIAACLLHNLCRREMPTDPFESKLDEHLEELMPGEGDTITHIDTTDQWTNWKTNLAHQIWNEWTNNN